MGHARCSFTCLISSITSERAEVLYNAVSTYQQHPRQEERRRQEAHSHSSCHYDFSRSLTRLQVILMVLLYGTPPAVCIDKVVCMKTKDEQHQKVRLTSESTAVCSKIKFAKLVYKINVNRMQEHLTTNQADQKCPGKVGATPWITEFLVYLFLQLNSKIHIVKTKSKS